MKIESGKFYKTRYGQKVGPMKQPPVTRIAGFNWADPENAAWRGAMWRDDGTFAIEPVEDARDIIAEWSEPMDLTSITTPFGFLDDATREALKAHGGPYEFFTGDGTWADIDPLWNQNAVYRVKLQPPKPREWFLGCAGRYCHVFDTREAAQTYVDHNTNATLIHVCEKILE